MLEENVLYMNLGDLSPSKTGRNRSYDGDRDDLRGFGRKSILEVRRSLS